MTTGWQNYLAPKVTKRDPGKQQTSSADAGSYEAYVQKAMDAEFCAVRDAPEGTRNDQLNRSAFALGQLVGAGVLAETTAETALFEAALACGLGRSESSKTISSGLESGKKEPRAMPEPKVASKTHSNGAPLGDGYRHSDSDAPDAPPGGDDQGEEPGAIPPQGFEPIHVADLLGPAIEMAERRSTGEERPVPLLFPAHAEIMRGGLWPGVHTCVAGTGIGKSTYWFQNARNAAEQGVPVLYIGLELNPGQVALRLLGEQAGVSWSKLYTGAASAAEIARVREVQESLGGLPLYFEFGPPNGWPASRMLTRAEQIRKKHPSGPLLIVLDFLQIVGADADDNGRTPELREAIKRAAYMGTHVGNKYGASVVLVSSAARDKYGLLASTCEQAGLVSRKIPGFFEPRRTILNPDCLLGLGKEAGEIEYAAESQSVLIRWPAELDTSERAVICAVPKLRYGPPSWFALSFWQRFTELNIEDTSELPEVQRGGSKEVPLGDLEKRVLETVRRNPNLTSKTKIVDNTKGTKSVLLKLADELIREGQIVKTDKGFEVRDEPKEPNQ